MRLRNSNEEKPDNYERCLVWQELTERGAILMTYSLVEDYFHDNDGCIERKHIPYWVPISEIIEELTK